MQRLMHNKVNFQVLNDNLSKKNFQLPLSVTDILHKNMDRMEELITHLKKPIGFNLIECASAMKMEQFEVFIMLAALMNSKNIKIIE